jgi:spermidine/putrescine transport system substrate-binding protein
MTSYIAEHGEPPRYSLFGDEDEAFNKMRAGFEPDVTYPCGISLKLWYDAGLLAPIDTGMIPNFEYVLDAFKNAPHWVVDGQRVYVPEDWGQTPTSRLSTGTRRTRPGRLCGTRSTPGA